MANFVAASLTEADQLVELLRHRRSHPERHQAVDTEIHDRFLTTCAIVVIDMAGFSRLTLSAGIISALEQIQTMRDLSVPLINSQSGAVLKVEADNLYASFETAEAALSAMQTLVKRLNEIRIHISVGIGYGQLLRVGKADLYGHEMNLASKLGEDLATDDDILLTESAYAALGAAHRSQFINVTQAVSGLTLVHHRLQS